MTLRASVGRLRILMLVVFLAPFAFSSRTVSAADDFDSLRAEIVAANRSSSGAISLSGDIILAAALPAITGSVTIDGGGHSISGDDAQRIFDVAGGRLAIKDLTLSKGRAPEEGHGGAIRLRNGAQVSIESSTISESEAFNGGAIATTHDGDSLTIIDSSINVNTADEYSGAIYVSRSSFVNNSASLGGAIRAMYTGTLDVINSTFIGNRARRGGAINSAGAQTNLTHISVSGGGLSIHDEDGTLRLRNSIVYTDDSLEGCHGVLTQNIGNLISDGSCDPAYRGDPLFGESTGDPVYLPPQVGSPAINAAHPAFCPATDQKGAPRPQDGGCDIGAIEMPPVVSDISDCLVATTHNLNFRDGPGGNRIGAVPVNSTVTATARTAGWFQVEHEGASGWISADYVVAVGSCG